MKLVTIASTRRTDLGPVTSTVYDDTLYYWELCEVRQHCVSLSVPLQRHQRINIEKEKMIIIKGKLKVLLLLESVLKTPFLYCQ